MVPAWTRLAGRFSAWVNKYSGILLPMGLFGPVLFTAAFLLQSRLPTPIELPALKSKVTVHVQPEQWSLGNVIDMFRPGSDGYQLSIEYPDAIHAGSDYQIKVSVTKVGGMLGPSGYVEIELHSSSLKIDPAGAARLPLEIGATTSFVISTGTSGTRLIRVVAKDTASSIKQWLFDPNREPGGPKEKVAMSIDKMLQIQALDSPAILGLSRDQLNTIEKISGAIGFPSLLLLLARWLVTLIFRPKDEEYP